MVLMADEFYVGCVEYFNGRRRLLGQLDCSNAEGNNLVIVCVCQADALDAQRAALQIDRQRR